MAEKVEMRCAYEWTCPECGRDNFERAVMVEMSDEDNAYMKEEYGVEPEATGAWLTRPDEVECKYCGMEFETEDVGEI